MCPAELPGSALPGQNNVEKWKRLTDEGPCTGIEAMIDALLRAVAECLEDGQPPSDVELPARTSVTEATLRLAVEVGLLARAADGWVLSAAGHRRAAAAVRRHRVLEAFLSQVIGLDWVDVHTEACRWETVAGDVLVERMCAQLGDPLRSPYGAAIPPYDANALSTRRDTSITLARLAASEEHTTARLNRVSETIQGDTTLLRTLAESGCLPGAELRITWRHEGFILKTSDGEVSISQREAAGVFVDFADE